MLLNRSRIVLNRIGEKRPCQTDEILELLRARPHEIEDLFEPRPPRAAVLLAPQPGLLEHRAHAPGKVVEAHPHEVLAVEPIELFRIEDGVARTDAAQ